MRFWTGGLLLMCAGVAPAQVTREGWFPGSSSISEAEIIPPAYRGVWAPGAAACREQYGVERITVLAQGLDSYESGGRLERVTQAGQERSIKLTLAYEGEGDFWDRTEIWTLNEAGTAMVVSDEANSTAYTLIRCDE